MPKSDTALTSSWENSYNESMQLWQPWVTEADVDLRMYLGDQFSEIDKAHLAKDKRTAFVYNRIARNVNNLAGFQRGARMGSACEPQEGSDQETADLFSTLLNWQMVSSDGYNLLSDAFKLGACVTGFNTISLGMDYVDDPVNGTITLQRDPYNSITLDAFWQGDFNLKTCRYFNRRRYVSKMQAKSLLPGNNKEIDQLECGANDGKYPHMLAGRSSDLRNLLTYDEHWSRTARPAKLLIDQLTGQTRPWKGSADNLKRFLKQFPFVHAMDIVKESVELTIFLNSIPMYNGPDPWGLNDYPIVPVVGYHTPESIDFRYRCQGIVRAMRDPQIDLNRTRSKHQDMMNSQTTSGWIVKNGALENPADLAKTGQGANIFLTPGANVQTDIVPIRATDLPQTWMQYSETISQEIDVLNGMNAENLGMQQRGDISGMALKLRMAAGRTTVAELLDNLDLSQKVLGQKIIALMQSNWSPEKVQRITGKPPTQEFYEREFGKYDCIVKQTDLTDTQRQLSFAQVMQARQMGLDIPQKFCIEQMSIADKTGLMKAFEEQAEAQKGEAEKLAQDEQMKRELQHAKVVGDLSLAAERRSRMVADEALARNRLSNADLDRARTLLEEIKAGKEIQAMDFNILKQVLDYARSEQEYHANQDRNEITAASDRAAQQAQAGPNQIDAGAIPNEQQLVGQ